MPLIGENVPSFCRYCLGHAAVRSYCRYACRSTIPQALSTGEPHYQHCWAGVVFTTMPIAPKGRCIGGIEVAGFFFGGEQADIRTAVAERLRAFPALDARPFLDRVDSLHEISPQALRGLGFFLQEATFSSGIHSPSFFRRQNRKYLQQRRIAEAVSDMRSSPASASPDIIGDTYRLVEHLHRHEHEDGMAFISQYLAKLLMASNWNLVKLRAHVRVLLAVMSSQEVLEGAQWDAVMSREMRYMTRIEEADDPESICYEVAELVMRQFNSNEREAWEHGSLAERAMTWLEHHYQTRATLGQAARDLGASVSTITHCLPEETGRTWAQLRTEVRVFQAKRLLATSELPISEVAAVCGFSDQSHLTKVLKQAINLTPGQFRRMLDALPDVTA